MDSGFGRSKVVMRKSFLRQDGTEKSQLGFWETRTKWPKARPCLFLVTSPARAPSSDLCLQWGVVWKQQVPVIMAWLLAALSFLAETTPSDTEEARQFPSLYAPCK